MEFSLLLGFMGNSNSDIETEILDSDFGSDQIPEEAKTSALMSDQRDLVKSNMHRSEFKRLIKEILNLGQDSQGFWKHLPYVMCDQPVNRFQVCLNFTLFFFYFLNLSSTLIYF